MSSIRSFIPLQKLGQGTYSNVYKVRRVDDDQVYALKKVKLTSLTHKQKQNALNEVRILASIESPYIVAYKEAFFDQCLSVLCVVMEYTDDGDLQKFIKTHIKEFRRIQQQQIWKAAQQILKGLENLHSRGILHRDVKCANIFKTKTVYKLGDLNVSKVNGDKLAYTQTGTPYYASPQVWRDQPYDHKSDIWSFGCIIYEMAALKPPFNGKDMQDLFKNVQKAKIQPLSGSYSTELWSFIELCLQKDPRKRPSASQLLENFQKYNSNSTGAVRINNPQSNHLLKTIKLPKDLKNLNQSLPTSKYRKTTQNAQNEKIIQISSLKHQGQIKQNRNQFAQSFKVNLNSQIRVNQNLFNKNKEIRRNYDRQAGKFQDKITGNKSALILPSERPIISMKNLNVVDSSNSYRSPKHKAQFNKILKSPISQVRLGKKVQNSLGYSQRLQKSDRKPSTASKVERLKRNFDFEMNIKDLTQKLKKPISMPRTQKMQTAINKSHLMQNPPLYHDSIIKNGQIQANGSLAIEIKYNSNRYGLNLIPSSNKYEALDNWRNKLSKKNRILSSNCPKPSWC